MIRASLWKISGARYYPKNFEKQFGPIDATENTKSPRDIDGHGTLTASIVTGQNLPGAEASGGFAHGTASGGAPMAYLAIYKVCWVLPNKPKAGGSLCFPADILAAVDDAIADGVNVLSISTGAQKPLSYDGDYIHCCISCHAKQYCCGVFCREQWPGVFCREQWPRLEDRKNAAPWIFTVGASSMDRMFLGPLIFDNGSQNMGQSVTPYELVNMHPLVRAIDVENFDVVSDEKGQRLDGSLSPENVEGKIVLCNTGK
ncbi:hypothetical protein HS088_TW10G00591 [Tripterygium wilfordii]|uniref:Peptidase S8/S53 domain-containing protein n=1 Tax=Tripterygium wilfordii TaxID=458696 RepID=A0A7J7D5L9_TRIWF|nr:hypothetical protein HS088_TW10G00591 [Tripterygium wilfordii]